MSSPSTFTSMRDLMSSTISSVRLGSWIRPSDSAASCTIGRAITARRSDLRRSPTCSATVGGTYSLAGCTSPTRITAEAL